MKATFTLIALALTSCTAPHYVSKGTYQGVEIAYLWKHPAEKPSELWLRLKNLSDQDRKVHVGIDLYYQGRTVEEFEADTCLPAGRSLSGKLNGIYFVPERITTAQIMDGSATVEMTDTSVEPGPCR